MYTRSIAEDLSLDTLLEVIRLSLMWGLTELSERAQQKVIEERMITPETYRAGQSLRVLIMSVLIQHWQLKTSHANWRRSISSRRVLSIGPTIALSFSDILIWGMFRDLVGVVFVWKYTYWLDFSRMNGVSIVHLSLHGM